MINVRGFVKNNPEVVFSCVLGIIVIIVYLTTFSSFKQIQTPIDITQELIQPQLENRMPEFNYTSIPKVNNKPVKHEQHIELDPPTVKEEIGLGIKYPQGQGVAMSPSDSNTFALPNPNALLSKHNVPQANGISNYADLTGTLGANEGAKIIKLVNTGVQNKFKPQDEDFRYPGTYSSAYDTDNTIYVTPGSVEINYNDSFEPEKQLKLTSSAGKESKTADCAEYFPANIKLEDICISKVDLPYGKIINNQVNPRLVSRWESYTNNYNPEEALSLADGNMYPKIKTS